MKPLIVLLATFLFGLLITKLTKGKFNIQFSGIVALSVMLIFTAIGHFVFTQGMSQMLPEWVPLRLLWVYATGGLEIAAAAALLIPRYRHVTGIGLMIFFVIILPANIYAAMTGLDYQTGTYTGPGMDYLWFRIPFQLVLLFWTYYFAVRPVRIKRDSQR